MLVSKIKEEDLSVEIIDRLLFQGLEDTGENVDWIIVLGSIKAAKYRVPVAVNAYKAGRASKIMLCTVTLFFRRKKPQSGFLFFYNRNKSMIIFLKLFCTTCVYCIQDILSSELFLCALPSLLLCR